MLEKDLAIQRGKLSKNADEHDCVVIMQRKGNLGMNAILSVSLAVARMIAHLQGRDLWQLLREEMEEVVAKTIIANDGLDSINKNLSPEAMDKVKSDEKEAWRLLVKEMNFESLIEGLQEVEAKLKQKGMKLHEALRKQMLIYA